MKSMKTDKQGSRGEGLLLKSLDLMARVAVLTAAATPSTIARADGPITLWYRRSIGKVTAEQHRDDRLCGSNDLFDLFNGGLCASTPGGKWLMQRRFIQGMAAGSVKGRILNSVKRIF
jgi:hypothetical protein